MTPEIDLILRLLSRNLDLSSEGDIPTQRPGDNFYDGYRRGLKQAAGEIRRARDELRQEA